MKEFTVTRIRNGVPVEVPAIRFDDGGPTESEIREQVRFDVLRDKTLIDDRQIAFISLSECNRQVQEALTWRKESEVKDG